MPSDVHSAAPALVDLTLKLEESTALDGAVRAATPLAHAIVANPTVRDVLQGRPLGHALHPVLTDLPIGAWLSATVLDLTAGPAARPAASRLLGLGILAAVPTAISGWSEWAEADRPSQRVGVVHAAANVLALSLYAGSWFARRGGRHGTGVAMSLAATTVAGAGAYLGGHLAVARKLGTRDPAYADGSSGHTPTGAEQADPPMEGGAGI
ncbi:DUF2231 domain-containing protein [Georgenia sp. SYP-B2076]|uniref:DUF2231 domain-containing protein n=1 Tax=Georgenia sp. SYP-B2076 TaxID=2495881 RepID=UPI000F8E67C6|nr:DUF2231 domain-containing protein [Georgenia sp. SYP-B2076]